MKQETRSPLLITTFFLLRRLIFAASVVFVKDIPIIQVGLNVFISLGMVIFIVQIKPFMNSGSVKFEIFNELTILMISYMQIPLLLDVVSDSEIQYKIGWAMIAITLCNLTVNFTALVFALLQFIIIKCKNCNRKTAKSDS